MRNEIVSFTLTLWNRNGNCYYNGKPKYKVDVTRREKINDDKGKSTHKN